MLDIYKFPAKGARTDGGTVNIPIQLDLCYLFYALLYLICEYYLNITFLPRSNISLNFSDVHICFRFSVLFDFVFKQM